ncbi:MAG: purine-nucleoside phosphorylase, partial [Flavobacteriales bacterium]|nr:purine-nucleoside phosphorylase [Flavobacteriales bacterium]
MNQILIIEETCSFLKKKGMDVPEIGIVLGTGLGG